MKALHIPTPFKPGHKIVRRYIEKLKTSGFKADVTKIDYCDKKGKLIEGFTLMVDWED